jgi:hypothetical protein
MEDGRTRIDLSFVGPIKFAGHYYIKTDEDRRIYQGPVNCGEAHYLGKNAVSAYAYWPAIGMSQKFFLMMTPDGQKQVSLALMSRGEHLLYAIIGENTRAQLNEPLDPKSLISGAACDLEKDPAAGYSEVLLHRAGLYEGEISTTLEGDKGTQALAMRQSISVKNNEIESRVEGSQFLSTPTQCRLKTNNWQAWTEAGSFVGSYSMYGGRALSGIFHDLSKNIRVWRREVVTTNGAIKCLVNIWYEGEKKIGCEWGFLRFRTET